MFVRICIELHILPRESEDKGSSPSTPPKSVGLKVALNTELEDVGGFENWRQRTADCTIAARMLDDPDSVLDSVDGENQYLLEGYFDDDFFHIYIDWKKGKQPFVRKVERERLRRRVK